MSPSSSRIQRLRLHAQPAALRDDRAQRAAIASVGAWLEAHPPQRHGLPADAIVLLRRLRAPLSALRGPEGDALLSRSLRSAVRLVHAHATGGGVGAGVEAVWFADAPELLACLARDAVSGELGRAWWWRTLTQTTPDFDTAFRRWLHQPRCVPSAMRSLQLSGHARPWLEGMGPSGRRHLLQALTSSHPLHSGWTNWLLDRVAHGGGDHAHASAEPTLDGRLDGAQGPMSLASASDRPPHDLRLDGSVLLLGLCDLMHQRPHRGLDGSSLSQLVRSLSEPTPPPSSDPPPTDAEGRPVDPLRPTQGPGKGASRPDRGTGTDTGAARQGVRRDAPGAPARPTTAPPTPPMPGRPGVTEHLGEGNGGHPQAEPSWVPWASWDATSDPGDAPHRGHALAAPRSNPPDGLNKRAHQPGPDVGPPVHAPFDTDAGGLFFMLNVALAWGLYGDFTQPRHRGLTVSPWQFLHASGVALLGRGFRADPLAGWLRAQTPFVPPSPWPPGSGRARGGPNELSVWWPPIRQRLAEVLDLPAPEALRTSLNLRARVRCTPDRVDVHLSLLELPLRIRIAGLDRDPGWIPAAGRDVRFHFEVPPT
jgi:hypothetical protein